MLKKIVIDNFLSFRNRTEIDFRKTSYTILPQNVNANKILKGAIFVGANASGKTNAVSAIGFLLELFFAEKFEDLNAVCLFGEKRSYSLKYIFDIAGEELSYEIEVGYDRTIKREILYVSGKLLFKREGKKALSYITDSKGVTYEDEVIEDAFFLRTVYFNTRFAGNVILMQWMEFLRNSVYCNLFMDIFLDAAKDELEMKKYLEKNGVDEINRFFKKNNFKQEIEYAEEDCGGNYHLINDSNEKIVFFRRNGIEQPIPMKLESLGNRTLLKLLPVFLRVIEKGGMLIIDEFSSGFHNDLEELLVRYFMKNAKNSQLFLVSHSTNLLKNSVFRPDQEYSVCFDGENGSVLKRFSDEQPRNAQNIEKMYNSGVFGGLPNYEEKEYENK